jgi:cytochrome c-type biogenesis protein CcmF
MNSFFLKKYLNPFSAIAHFALGLLIISISFNSLLSSERALNIKINEFEEYKDLKIFFKDIKVLKNSNHDSIEATFVLENQKGRTFDLSPEKRRYFTRGQITTETAIFIMPLKDIYMTIGDQLDDGSWIVNIQINYLIRWIWFSAGLMAFAGMVLMSSKRNI